MHVRVSPVGPAREVSGSFAALGPRVLPQWRVRGPAAHNVTDRRALGVSAVLHISALAALLCFGWQRQLQVPEPGPSIAVVFDAVPANPKPLPPMSDAVLTPPPEPLTSTEPPLAAVPDITPPPANTAPSVAAAPPTPLAVPEDQTAPPVATEPTPPMLAPAVPLPRIARPVARPLPQAAVPHFPPRRVATPEERPRFSPPEASSAPAPSAPMRPEPSPAATAPLVPPRPISGLSSNPQPAYPESALRRGVEGRVVLRVNVSATGEASALSVLRGSGNSSLDDAALAAVRRWRFVPASRSGVAIAGVADVPVDFHIAR